MTDREWSQRHFACVRQQILQNSHFPCRSLTLPGRSQFWSPRPHRWRYQIVLPNTWFFYFVVPCGSGPEACFSKFLSFGCPNSLFICNAEFLSHQTSQSSWFFLHWKHVKRSTFQLQLDSWIFGPEKFLELSRKRPWPADLEFIHLLYQGCFGVMCMHCLPLWNC